MGENLAMRVQSKLFRLSAAAAVAGMVFGPAVPVAALAQPAPPQAAPDQNTVDPPARVGRLALLAGMVSFHAQSETQWTPASVNYPVASGDSYWTEPNAGVTFEISDNLLALAGGTEFDVGTLDPSGLQATLPQGAAYVRIRGLAPNETWSVQTPRGQVTLQNAGRYEIVAGDTENPTMVTVLQGAAQITGPNVSIQVSGNQTATIVGTDTFQASVGPVRQDAFLTAMLARERPPVQSAAPAIVATMPGGYSLANYGTWTATSDYGQVWYPQVASGWAPYREGHWAYIPPWGWTWVDSDPWGFAPFHYGRWVQIGGRWGWTPGSAAVAGPPIYAPALVTFFGVGVGVGVGIGLGAALAAGSVGWIPLAPHETYHPWYHASPRYLQEVNVRHVTNVTSITNVTTINNYINRSAATVVPANVMADSRPVRQAVRPISVQELAAARPLSGREPIRPTAATAGVTPAYAQRMHFAPAPAGAAPRVAPGPVIRAQATETRPGSEVRPPLATPSGHATPGAAATTAHPRTIQPGTAQPGMTRPVGRQGEHPGERPGEHPAGEPALRPPGGERPAVLRGEPQVPGVAPAAPREAAPATGPHAVPQGHGPTPQVAHPAEPGRLTEPQRPAERAAPPPHPAAVPPVHAPAPQFQHPAEAPGIHAPAAQEHAPLPQVHEPNAPIHTPAPYAASPQAPHAALPVTPHAALPQASYAPPPQVPHAPPPQARPAPPPAAHSGPQPAREKRPGEP
jgi:hypothetical protein